MVAPHRLRRALLGVALVASLASPAPTPETTQGPIWEGEAYASSGGVVSITEAAPLAVPLTARLTIPASGSGTTTSAATVLVNVSNPAASTLQVALLDGAGAELAAAEVDASGQDTAGGYRRLSARDVLAGCEVGVACEVPMTLKLAVEGAATDVYWEVYVEARDGTVGADGVWVEMELVAG